MVSVLFFFSHFPFFFPCSDRDGTPSLLFLNFFARFYFSSLLCKIPPPRFSVFFLVIFLLGFEIVGKLSSLPIIIFPPSVALLPVESPDYHSFCLYMLQSPTFLSPSRRGEPPLPGFFCFLALRFLLSRPKLLRVVDPGRRITPVGPPPPPPSRLLSLFQAESCSFFFPKLVG